MRAAGQCLIRYRPTGDDVARTAGLARIVGDGDVAFTNLEVAMAPCSGSVRMRPSGSHVAGEGVLHTLAQWGFDTVSLANNHVGDLGPSGAREARRAAARRGWLAAGVGDGRVAALSAVAGGAGIALVAVSAGFAPLPGAAVDPDGALPGRSGVATLRVRRRITADPERFAALRALVESTGHARRVERERLSGRMDRSGALDVYGVVVERGAVCAELDEAVPEDVAELLASVGAAADAGNRVLVSIHNHAWAPDWSAVPTWLRGVARSCVDVGACMVLCHGVPVMSGMEVYRGRLCCFGLGNFVFHTHRTGGYPQAEVWRSVVVAADCDPDGSVQRVELRPVALSRVSLDDGEEAGGFPGPAGPADCEAALAWVDSRSRPFGCRVRQTARGAAELEW